MKILKVAFVLFCMTSITAYALNDSFLKMVSTGGPRSLDEAFVLLEKTEGAEAENLTVAIGKSIVKSPKSFLKTVKKHKPTAKELNSIVASFENSVTKDKDAQKKEVELRIESLKSVSEQDLKIVRDQCIATLEKKVKQL